MDADILVDAPNSAENVERLWTDLTKEFPAAELGRIRGLLDVWSGRHEPAFAPMQSMIRGLFVPDLPTAPWLDANLFSFKSAAEGLYPTLKRRLTAARDAGRLAFRPYGMSPDAPENAEASPKLPKGWKELAFYDGYKGAAIDKHVAMFPEVTALIEAVLSSQTLIQELGLLVLEPGARIRRHVDSENYFVTCQMGLQVPKQCGIRAGTEERRWVEGEMLVFDNSFLHEVWNDDHEHARIILSLSTLHPSLTHVERQAMRVLRRHLIAVQ
jgi:hypothetical protein